MPKIITVTDINMKKKKKEKKRKEKKFNKVRGSGLNLPRNQKVIQFHQTENYF